MGEGEEPITLIKPVQIVIVSVMMDPLFIEPLNENAKIPIRGSNLVAGIDIITNQDIMS
jgi:hypothetical protein